MIFRSFVNRFLVCILSFCLIASGAQAKFRNAINFSDNEFLDIAKTEVFHSIRTINGSDSEGFDRTVLNYSLTTGILKNFEFGVNVPIHYFDDGGGDELGNISLHQRFKFTNERSGIPATSGGIELELPTGDDDETTLATGDFNARLFGSVGSKLNQNWAWIANTGFKFFGDSDVDGRFDYNGAIRYQMDELYRLNTELNGSTGGIQDNSQLYLSPGVIFHNKSGFNLMVSLPVGLTDESADHRATVQLSHEF